MIDDFMHSISHLFSLKKLFKILAVVLVYIMLGGRWKRHISSVAIALERLQNSRGRSPTQLNVGKKGLNDSDLIDH